MFKKLRKILICFTVCSAVLLQCGCSNGLNFRLEYDKGMRAYNEKKYDVAVINFNNALTYKPDSYSALCLLGTSYAYSKDEKMAEKTFQDAIKLFPNNWNAYVFMGDLKRSGRDYQAATEFYETAVSLESMGGKEKTYYKKVLKELKIEESAYESKNPYKKAQNVEDFKKAVNEQNLSKAPSAENENGDVTFTLDAKKWDKVIDQKDDKSKTTGYGIKGEDVRSQKWTQLVTAQYFLLGATFPPTLEAYFNNHISAIDAMAKNSGKTFEKKIIAQSKNNMLYEWKFDNAKESEISRIVFTGKGIYHLHYSKKGAFTTEERAKALEIIKSAILK